MEKDNESGKKVVTFLTCEKSQRVQVKLAEIFSILEFHVNLVLMTMFGWGLWAAFIGGTPTAVSEEKSHTAYMLWVAWHLLAPPVLWIGEFVRDKRIKWRLRWAGDSALCVMIATHVIALIPQVRAEVVGAGYLLAVMAGMSLVAFFLATRDLIEVFRLSHWCRQ